MKKLTGFITILTIAAVAAVAQQPAAQPPIASNPVVEIKGTITKVQAAPGRGMPFLEMQSGAGTTKVLLGAMRYLMRENFNPKAGSEVEVRGYKTADQVVAISVTLPGENKTLKLRDERGYPVWMGGHGRGARMRGCCGPQEGANPR